MKNLPDEKVRKLNYVIHNPNTIEVTNKVLLGAKRENVNWRRKRQRWLESYDFRKFCCVMNI